jgi:hypothetical protein
MAIRTGMLVDEKGTNAPFPAMPAQGADAYASEIRTLMDHAAHLHTQNQLVFNYEAAKLAKGVLLPPPPQLPNLDARRAALKQREAHLAQIKQTAVDKVSKLLGQRDALKPFNYDPAGYPMRSEMRSLARTMSEADRMALAKSDPSFVEALTETPAWMTGLPPSQHEALIRNALEARFGPRLRELEAGIAAGEAVLELHGTVARALQNEKVTVGAVDPPPPPAPPPNPQWELMPDNRRSAA